MSMVNRKGVSLVETVIVSALMVVVVTAAFTLLSSAQNSFSLTDASIDVRNSLRQANERVASELRNTGYKNGVPQFSILDGAGFGGSDILRFSIPILCSTTATLLDANGNPAYWGAPLRWGCDQSSCMDANNDCSTLEYKYIQYSINSSNQLVRDVLDGALTKVAGSSKIMAQNISDFQVSFAGQEITMQITGQKKSVLNRTVTVSMTNKVWINNQGG